MNPDPIDSPVDESRAECAIVELRQYTLHPGQRDVLIEVFEREFVEPQEALGMTLLGQFRDLDDPDRFVWLRGFANMPDRARALAGFYDGPVWQAHREVANATMIDSDNVLLLRPAWPGAGLRFDRTPRAPAGTQAVPPGLVDIAVFPLDAPADAALIVQAKARATPVLEQGGAGDVAWYVTDASPNTFPRLPVRTGNALVRIAVFPDEATHAAFVRNGAWDREVAPFLKPRLLGEIQSMRLVPTARSALHY